MWTNIEINPKTDIKIVNNTVENSYFDKFKIMSLKYFCNGIFMKKI